VAERLYRRVVNLAVDAVDDPRPAEGIEAVSPGAMTKSNTSSQALPGSHMGRSRSRQAPPGPRGADAAREARAAARRTSRPRRPGTCASRPGSTAGRTVAIADRDDPAGFREGNGEVAVRARPVVPTQGRRERGVESLNMSANGMSILARVRRRCRPGSSPAGWPTRCGRCSRALHVGHQAAVAVRGYVLPRVTVRAPVDELPVSGSIVEFRS